MQNWQSQPPPMMQNQPFGSVSAVNTGKDQTLPIISLVLGILGVLLVCCWGGLPFGIGALVTGYLGMKNADGSPERYTGRSLAIGGLVLGAIGLIGTVLMIFLGIISKI